MERTAGIDWGSQEHAVCVLNADGSVLTQFTVPHTAAGLAEPVIVAAGESYLCPPLRRFSAA